MSSPPLSEPIAIVGSSCRFSGNANSPSVLWNLLLRPRDLSRSPPLDRFDINGFYHADPEHHGATNALGSYFIDDDVRLFDASFFKITPKEAEAIDPQHRLLLESVYEAMESAGLTIQQLQGSSTSVYVGLMIRDFMDIQVRDPDYFSQYMVTGTSSALNANRISYFFDWKGPSLTIDTACSSSLVAIHQAVLGLRAGESQLACVSGSNLLLGPELFISAANMHMLSSRSRMWDASAEGYARGDGFATILLKKLSNAIRDGDHIEAVIRETGVNSDGRTTGITMPSSDAQASLIRETYRKAGLDPTKESDRCQYFEAHGTGTQAGDPQEASAIHKAFFGNVKPEPQAQKLLVGSIKTVVGHTEGAAGIAGVLKASLALRHGLIPPNLHFKVPNPTLVPFLAALEVPTEILSWPSTAHACPRRASVNSFGFGGTNAHAILESYSPEYHNLGPWMQKILDPQQLALTGEERPCLPLPFVFSANTAKALGHMMQNYVQYLDCDGSVNLRDLSWTLLSRRSLLPVRAAFGDMTSSGLSKQMRKEIEHIAMAGDDLDLRSKSIDVSNPSILGIFTGQGAQWPTMGRGLITSSVQFSNTMKKLENALESLPDPPAWSLMDELAAPPSRSRLSEAALSQPLCTAVQIGLVDILRSSGVVFRAVVGHSSGEIAAAYAAGILTAEDGIRIAYYRGVHAGFARGDAGAKGSMLAAGMSLSEAKIFTQLPSLKSRISVAASNSTASVTLSGDADAIQEAKQILDDNNKFARVLQVDTAYHSHHMLPCAGPYITSMRTCGIGPREADSSCSWISSVYGSTGAPGLEELKAQYWSDNMTKAVLFSQALQRAIVECGPFDAVIEVGPHPALKGPATQTMREFEDGEAPYTGLLDRKLDDMAAFNTALAFLWRHLGPFIDFAGYENANYGKDVSAPLLVKDLPLYPWDHDNGYWRESRLSKEYRLRNTKPHPLLGNRSPGSLEHELRWRNILRRQEVPWLMDYKVQNQAVLPAGAYCAMMLDAAGALSQGREIHLIELLDVQLLSPIIFANDSTAVEVVTSIRRLVSHQQEVVVVEGKSVLEAEFSLSAGSPDGEKPLKAAASSRVHIVLGTAEADGLPRGLDNSKSRHQKAFDIDGFYSTLRNLGLSYTDSYLGLYEAERSWHEASAVIRKQHRDETGSMCLNPSFMEGCIQMGYLAFAHPDDGNLWSPFLPQRIGRLVANPKLWETDDSYDDATFEITSHITRTHAPTTVDMPSFVAYVEVYDPIARGIQLQMEDVTFTALSLTDENDDRELFFSTSWDYDVTDNLFPDELHETPEAVQTREALDRIASFYLRDLKLRGLLKGTASVCQPLADAIMYDLNSRLAIDRESKTSHEEIADLISRLQPRIDLRFMKAIWNRLIALLSAANDNAVAILPPRFLETLPVFEAINKHNISVIRALSHRFPQMHVLEISPERVGPYRSLSESVVGGFSSYVFGSIGSGSQLGEGNTGDIHKVPIASLSQASLTQKVPQGGYDLAIVSFILHGRSSMDLILSDLRALMKPGGFILLVEPTENYDWLKFLLCGLLDPNSPLHYHQNFGLPLSLTKLDNGLRRKGFSGVDHIEQHSGVGVIVSQVVDEKINMIRYPLLQPSLATVPGNLLLIGGRTLWGYRILKDLTRTLQGFRGEMIIESSLETLRRLESKSDTSFTAVVVLEDWPDQGSSSSDGDLHQEAMLNLFSLTKTVLWVALEQKDNSSSYAANAEWGRCLAGQQLNFSFHTLLLDRKENAGDIIAKRLLRQIHCQSWHLSRTTHVWADETEVRIIAGRAMIPRVLPDLELNDRLNSERRVVTRDVRLSDCDVTLASNQYDGLFTYYAQKSNDLCRGHDRLTDGDKVQICCSSLLAVRVGSNYLHASIGRVHGGDEKVLILTPTVSSTGTIRKSMSVPLTIKNAMECRVLELFLHYWVADMIFDTLLPGQNVLFEPDDVLASILSVRCNGTNKKLTYLTNNRHHIANSQVQWIFIHPRSSKANLKSLIPQHAKRFISLHLFANQRVRRILDVLPTGCSISEDAFFQTSSKVFRMEIESHYPDLSEAAMKSSTETPGLATIPWGTSQIMGASELAGARGIVIKPFGLVDWTDVGMIPAISRPLVTDRFLCSDRTYILIDVENNLAECIARWMVMYGACHIAVVHRSTDDEPVPWGADLQRLGIRIDSERFDCQARTETKRLSESFPFTAGIVYGGALKMKHIVQDFLDSSINATINLDETFESPALEFFVMLAPWTSAYEVNTQFKVIEHLDALVSKRRARRMGASMIAVPRILGVDLTASSTAPDRYFAEISEADFHVLMHEAIALGFYDARNSPRLITSLKRVKPAPNNGLPAWRLEAKFSHLIIRTKEASSRNSKGLIQDVKQQLVESESPKVAVNILVQSLKEHLTAMLGLAVDAIKDNMDLVTLGIDSLMASDVRSWFIKKLDIDVSVLQVLGGSTIKELCEEVVSEMQFDFCAQGNPAVEDVPLPAPGSQACSFPVSRTDPLVAPVIEQSGSFTSWTPILTDDIESIRTSESAVLSGILENDAVQVSNGSTPFAIRKERMSYGQTRLWFPSSYLDQKTAFNCTTSYRIAGPLDLSRLSRALKQVTQRHEIFRTSFTNDPSDSQPIQAVFAESHFQLRTLSGNKTTDVDREFRRTADYIFNLEVGDAFIASVVSHTPQEHTIVFGYHHIIMDGVSWQITLSDMAALYNNQSDQLRSPVQYVDFALHSSRLVQTGAHEKKLAFWRNEFPDAPEPVPLFPFSNVSSRKALTQYNTLDVVRHIDRKLVANIKRASLGAKTTSFHFYLAAFQTMLHAFLGINEICLGIIDANRTDQKFLHTVGFLLDMLPLNLRLNSKERFTTTMVNTRNKAYAALSNSSVPLETIIRELQVPTASTHTPLFQILINYRMGALKAPRLGEADMGFLDYEDAKSPFDLALSIDEKDDGTGMLTFSTQDYLYDQTGMTLIVETYVRFLDILSTDPSLRLFEIQTFDEAFVTRGIQVGTGKTIDYGWPSTETVAHRVDLWVESQPNAIAVKDTHSQSLTYQQMSQRTNAIAHSLTATGVKTGALVAVFCEPTVDSICCILAILRLGAAYVALDVRNAPERLAAVVQESRPAAILFHYATKGRLEGLDARQTPLLNIQDTAQAIDETLPQLARLASPAIIQYTSGTTGRPKGIILTHYNLAVHCASAGERLRLERDVLLQQSGLGFDASIAQIFYALVFGGTIIMGDNRGDPTEIAELIRSHKVTVTLIMISEMSALLDYGSSILSRCSSWRISMCGGEAFTMNLVRKFQKLDLPDLKLFNAYGPSETTIISSIGEVPYRTTKLADDHKVPVGPPISNYGVYVLDETQQAVPLGWPGELCIAGPGVASGYLGLPELTASNFKPDSIPKPGGPYDGWKTIYQTGDRARMLADGSFLYLGRIDGDTQVKLRGIRIELDEVTKSILHTSEGVLSDAATIVRGESSQILVAYVVFSHDKGAMYRSRPDDYLRQLLLSLPLPIYMRPAVAVPMDFLPFTERGKLDTKALEAIPLVRHDEELRENEILTDSEDKLKKIWEDILSEVGVGLRIDKHSDFFSVGGNSLLLMRVRSKIQSDFGVSVSLASLFQASTLESLAAKLQGERPAPSDAQVIQQSLIDWDMETRIPAELTSTKLSPRSWAPSRAVGKQEQISVVLTGSTGFLGTEILRQLVTHPNVTEVYCIAIRSGRSVRGSLAMSPKVISYAGNLADRQLGLSDSQAQAIFNTATAIIHNGAEVSHMKSYHSLRVPNVESTKELLRLCTLHAESRLPSFHYVSSAGVGHLIPPPSTRRSETANEDKFLPVSLAQYPPPRDGSDGYVAAKWASEQTLEHVAAAVPGLRVVVHRPSNVTGNGVSDQDIVHSLMRYSLALKAVPDMEAATGAFDFIGVDACAAGIVEAVFKDASNDGDARGRGSVWYEHRAGSTVILVDQLAKYLGQRCGMPELPVIPWPEWLDRARAEGLDELVVEFLKEVNGKMRLPLLVEA